MLKRAMLALGSFVFLATCVGCDAVSIVGDSLSFAGGIVSLFGD